MQRHTECACYFTEPPYALTWKLAISYAWRHPSRMLLTSIAMIASACVVVWVVSGYDAMVARFGGGAVEYLGRFDLFVVPDSTKRRNRLFRRT